MRNVLIPFASGLLAASFTLAAHAQGAGGAAPDAMMKVDTPTFAKLVSSSNAFEIRSSELAKEKASQEALKSFADQMVKDHTKADEDFNVALGAAGEAAPSGEPLSPKHAGMIKLLEGASGAEFDTLYVDMQVGAHMEAVSLFQTFADGGDKQEIKDFAAKTLPTLAMHKEHILDIAAE